MYKNCKKYAYTTTSNTEARLVVNLMVGRNRAATNVKSTGGSGHRKHRDGVKTKIHCGHN